MNFLTKRIIRSSYYNFLRYSAIPNAIVELKTSKTRKNISFYKKFLPEEQLKKALVFDIGANKGNKTKAFLALGCKVVCVEPEKKCLETLHYRYKNNPEVIIVNKGVSDKEGEMTLHVQEFRSGYNTLSDKWVDALEHNGDAKLADNNPFTNQYQVAITTLDKLIEELGNPFYIKIDVEGLELNVIKGLSSPVPFITFEANLPEFLSETIEIVNIIDSLSGGKTTFKTGILEQIKQEHWMDKQELLKNIQSSKQNGVEIICRSELS